MAMMSLRFTLFVVYLKVWASAQCPYIGTRGGNQPCPLGSSARRLSDNAPTVTRADTRQQDYLAAARRINYNAVKADLKVVFTTSKSDWPADYGNYAPFFIRLAWHCSGSYRSSDGRGGCDGGRIRFDPERSWEDNTNLDKARALLVGVKEKYGLGLSWGDLIVLAGNTAIESMGGPLLGFCGGRMDSQDGTASAELGPSSLQREDAPCVDELGAPAENGECTQTGGLGSTTVGLIYLNPEGPMGIPIPNSTAETVRDAFGRMGMNDSETVALIGGGHAFGKTHGACPLGVGPSPIECQSSKVCSVPWAGYCGSGKGADAFTSGFEGPWTSKPTEWDNEYFRYLRDFEYEVHNGPGDHWQWRVAGATSPQAPGAQGGTQDVMMLTSDISLLHDPLDEYQQLVERFASDQEAFDNAFKHAWYKLTTRDMGPVSRCVGNDVPVAQDWQYPLPARSNTALPDFDQVKQAVVELVGTTVESFDIARLAWQCSATFRATDHLGGCNGARIRFSPERDWPANAQSAPTLAALGPIKERFGEALSWADLIVVAGQAGLENMGLAPQAFVGGRTDASDGEGSTYLNATVAALTGEVADTAFKMMQAIKVMGLTNRELVLLMGSGLLLPRSKAFTETPGALNNAYFQNLLNETWDPVPGTETVLEYKARGKELYMLPADLALLNDTELATFVGEYSKDNSLFVGDFGSAWGKTMNIDRFDLDVTTPPRPDNTYRTVGLAVGIPVAFIAVAGLAFFTLRSRDGADAITSTSAGPGADSLLNNDHNQEVDEEAARTSKQLGAGTVGADGNDTAAAIESL